MHRPNDPSAYINARDTIDPNLMAARLEAARVRRFDNAAAAIDALKAESGDNWRRYYGYESGERKPKMAGLYIISKVFEVPIEYFLFGTDSETYEGEARTLAQRARITLKIDEEDNHPLPVEASPEKDPEDAAAAINYEYEQGKLNTSHNQPVRFIPILSANEIRQLSTGRGDLADMSGRTMPVPDFLNASRHSYNYQIPSHDVSMVAADGISIGPGSVVLADPDAPIFPGSMVLALLRGHDEPMIRKYIAAGAYKPGMRFKLGAFNPAFEAIEVSKKLDCLSIARIIFFGTPV